MKYMEVDIFRSIAYNSSACRSALRPKEREHFFDNLDKYDFKQYMEKVTRDKARVKIKRKICSALRSIKRDLLNHEGKST